MRLQQVEGNADRAFTATAARANRVQVDFDAGPSPVRARARHSEPLLRAARNAKQQACNETKIPDACQHCYQRIVLQSPGRRMNSREDEANVAPMLEILEAMQLQDILFSQGFGTRR